MKNKSPLLVGALALSLFANIFLSMRFTDTTPCDNKGRYSEKEVNGAGRLDQATASEMVSQYRNQYPPEHNEGHPTGFVFSKRMFDEIFTDASMNAVSLDLVTYNNNISLVVKGMKTESTKIDGDGDQKIYVLQSFCPADCSQW